MQFDLATAIPVLERTPAALDALLRGLPDAWTTATEGPDTWSPFQVVGHLVRGERTDWIPRARIILAQGPDRRFPPFDRTAMLREAATTPLAVQLDDFARLRAEGLATLRGWNLGEAELALEGEHPAFGPVTLRQLLATWVAHDLGHLVQVSRTMARQYAEAVGPWQEYLSVVRPRG